MRAKPVGRCASRTLASHYPLDGSPVGGIEGHESPAPVNRLAGNRGKKDEKRHKSVD